MNEDEMRLSQQALKYLAEALAFGSVKMTDQRVYIFGLKEDKANYIHIAWFPVDSSVNGHQVEIHTDGIHVIF